MKPTIANDTATAESQVAISDDLSLAAIGSEDSAHLYRLAVYARYIEDDSYNYTRFIYIHKSSKPVDHANKCALQLELAHKPGSLVDVLQIISDHGLNLTKIESRPIHGKPFEYRFYLDFEFTQKQRDIIDSILSDVKKHCDRMKILGVYKAGIINV
jgi:chorismate mutase/prephenate dehydratase